jgi:hypothetical protein
MKHEIIAFLILALVASWCVFVQCDSQEIVTDSSTVLGHHHQSHRVRIRDTEHDESLKVSLEQRQYFGEKAINGDQTFPSITEEEVQEVREERHVLRGSSNDKHLLQSSSGQGRRMPGYTNLGGPEKGGIVLLVIVVLILLFCCRGMLCDILACVCLYEICCDDGAVGGFSLM